MTLKKFTVEPSAETKYFGAASETVYTGRNTVTIELNCNDTECNALYAQFKMSNKDDG